MGLQFPKKSKAPAYVATPPPVTNFTSETSEGMGATIPAGVTNSPIEGISSGVDYTAGAEANTFAGFKAPGAH